MSKNVLCTICARGGSKGVKNKNVRIIHGKPLIAYTVEQAKDSQLFDHIVVSTDSDAIAEAAVAAGAEVFFKRPEELATDAAAKIPVIRHAFLESEKHYKKQYDYLVDLDATSPLRNVEDIVNAYKMFLQNDHDNVITAMPSRRSPYFNMVEVVNGKVSLAKKPEGQFVRRQDVPATYDMNASIYIWKREILLKENAVFLDKTGLYVMPEERSIDIDSELDYEIVQLLLGKRNV